MRQGGFLRLVPAKNKIKGIAVGVAEACFPPQPRLIGRLRIKMDTVFHQSRDLRIERIAFKVDDGALAYGQFLNQMQGKRAFTDRAFKARITRHGQDNQPQTERLIELDRTLQIQRRQGYLVSDSLAECVRCLNAHGSRPWWPCIHDAL